MEKEKYFRNRQEKIFQWLREHDVFAAIFSDDEDLRDVSIRYFTGHPADATLILTRDGNSILIPWDEILASKMAMAVFFFVSGASSDIALAKTALSIVIFILIE